MVKHAPHDDAAFAAADAAERARSVRRVAIHEYAHYHVARAFGIAGHVRIAPCAALVAAGGREHYSGCFVPVVPMIPCHAAQVIALAGPCADARLAFVDTSTAARLCAWLAGGEHALSPGDALLAGDYRDTDVAEALVLVGAAWAAIERDAAAHATAVERMCAAGADAVAGPDDGPVASTPAA